MESVGNGYNIKSDIYDKVRTERKGDAKGEVWTEKVVQGNFVGEGLKMCLERLSETMVT